MLEESGLTEIYNRLDSIDCGFPQIQSSVTFTSRWTKPLPPPTAGLISTSVTAST